MEPAPRLRATLLLRYTLIIATAYLLLAERQFADLPAGAAVLIALALASNVVVGQLPHRWTESAHFGLGLILFDTAWVTAALMAGGDFSADFFMLYFFVLLLAAVGETLAVNWTKVDGPGSVIFGDPNATNTTASFSEGGVYQLRLTVDDGISSTSSLASYSPFAGRGPRLPAPSWAFRCSFAPSNCPWRP